jgi:hypothetical protein
MGGRGGELRDGDGELHLLTGNKPKQGKGSMVEKTEVWREVTEALLESYSK